MKEVLSRLAAIEENQISSSERQALSEERITALHLCKQEFVDILDELNPKMLSFSESITLHKKDNEDHKKDHAKLLSSMETLTSEMSDFIEWKKRGTIFYRGTKKVMLFLLDWVKKLKKLIVWVGAFAASLYAIIILATSDKLDKLINWLMG